MTMSESKENYRVIESMVNAVKVILQDLEILKEQLDKEDKINDTIISCANTVVNNSIEKERKQYELEERIEELSQWAKNRSNS